MKLENDVMKGLNISEQLKSTIQIVITYEIINFAIY